MWRAVLGTNRPLKPVRRDRNLRPLPIGASDCWLGRQTLNLEDEGSNPRGATKSAGVAKSGDAAALNPAALKHAGSSPVARTNLRCSLSPNGRGTGFRFRQVMGSNPSASANFHIGGSRRNGLAAVLKTVAPKG
jgi:hypothetical protein